MNYSISTIKCIFDNEISVSVGDKFYYYLVSVALSILSKKEITLDYFSDFDGGREIIFNLEDEKLYLSHSWKYDGTYSKPKTTWIDKHLGRFAIWSYRDFGAKETFKGPYAYAEDLYDILKKELEG